MLLLLPLLATLAHAQAAPATGDPEARIVSYLKENVKPGQRVVVSQLYNEVFTEPAERAALNRLFNTFFQIPLFVAQYYKAEGRPPSLAEIAQQFRFGLEGQAELMLRIMESDPRMPKFLKRNPESGEIEKVDVEAILAHPRFSKLLERTIAGFEGRPAAPWTLTALDGSEVSSAALSDRPYLLYFWFTNCPPCVKTAPLLAELQRSYAPKGFLVVGVNADRVLEVPVTESERAAHVEKSGMRFVQAHMTAEMQEAFGQVSVFPTLFFVDGKGTIVKHFVNFQDKQALEAAIRLALQ